MSINKIKRLGVDMRNPFEVEELICKSIINSNLFKSEWESMFYSIILQMILEKGGGIEEFLKHYTLFDFSDYENYFKHQIIGMYGSEIYTEIEKYLFGEDDDV